MKPIRFNKHYRNYNPGETAHFAIDVADKLIAAGVATDGSVATVTTATAAADTSDPKSGKADKRVQAKAANAQPD